MKKLFFFGCLDSIGHYLTPALTEKMKTEMPDVNFKIFQYVDGLYVPRNHITQGSAHYVWIPPGLSIIAWHDYTVDKRPGSNSNIIGHGYTGSPNTIALEMFEDFKLRFPRYYERQTHNIHIYNLQYIRHMPGSKPEN